MEPDSSLDFVVDDLPGIGRSYQMTGTNGAILGGAFFKPAVVEEVEAVFEDLLIDWVALEPTSPGVDRSIAEMEIRRTTGVTIIAIICGDRAVTAPQPSEILRVGDRLVVVSRPQDLGRSVNLSSADELPGPPRSVASGGERATPALTSRQPRGWA